MSETDDVPAAERLSPEQATRLTRELMRSLDGIHAAFEADRSKKDPAGPKELPRPGHHSPEPFLN